MLDTAWASNAGQECSGSQHGLSERTARVESEGWLGLGRKVPPSGGESGRELAGKA